MRYVYFLLFGLSMLARLTAEDLAAGVRQADQAEQRGETDRAIEILKQMQTEDHDNPQIEKRLSRLYSRKIEDTNVPSTQSRDPPCRVRQTHLLQLADLAFCETRS